MSDFNEERHTSEKETVRKMECKTEHQMKARTFTIRETQLNQGTVDLLCLNPFITENGNRESFGMQYSAIECALHKSSSIPKTWQDATVCVYIFICIYSSGKN